MEQPHLRRGRNRGEDGPVVIAVSADDEAGGGKNHGPSDSISGALVEGWAKKTIAPSVPPLADPTQTTPAAADLDHFFDFESLFEHMLEMIPCVDASSQVTSALVAVDLIAPEIVH